MQVRVCRKLYGPASHPGDLHSCTKKGAGAGRQAKHLPPTTFSSTTEPPALTPHATQTNKSPTCNSSRHPNNDQHLTPTPTQKKKSVAWDSDGDGVQTSIRILLDWLGADDNYARWRGNGSGLTKVALANEIVLELAKVGIEHRNIKGITNKVTELQGAYAGASDLLRGTGGGVTDEDIAAGIANIHDSLVGRCKYWDELHPIMGARVASNPPVTNESTDTRVPNLLRGRATEETEDDDTLDSPRDPLVSSDAHDGPGEGEDEVTVGRTGGTKRKAAKSDVRKPWLEKVLAESNAHRIKCFEARERRDRTKALIEDRKVLVLENEARARANQMEMAEIRDRLRFMRELKDLGLPESQIREYMKAQFNVGEPSGSNRATTKKTSTIELGDDDDDEDEEDEEDDGEVVE
ncbi:hypothetical protein PSTT_16729 [Puccinia striiformis]|uniref:Uncharacterized protein n=3 Tax=Puccinia striiformis TaxID=27350 RepID=A0A2S4UBL3_9BASI|nr:hypothetical protein PSTT_16729 [Puccinia striiformis]